MIVEGPSKKDPAVLSGRTVHNKLIHFPSDPLRVGTFAEVRVLDAAMQYLTGELVEVTAKPRHRTRIPVVSA